MPRGKTRPILAEKLKYEQLVEYTDNFSEENFLGTFRFGKVYRGIIIGSAFPTRPVMVKMWESLEWCEYVTGDHEARVMLEIILLRHERLKSHQGLIELYGYCWDDDNLGAVYNFNPLDTLHNLIPKDSFTWLQRIKVAVGFGRLLKFLHTGDPALQPFLLRNISAAHIALDQEYNAKLFDFGMISGGIFPDRTTYENYYLNGCYGYIDPYTARSGYWSDRADVFAFGCLLLYLITKRVPTEEHRCSCKPTISSWALDLYVPEEPYEKDKPKQKPIRALVEPSLAMDSDFCSGDGRKITKLAIRCIDGYPQLRPTMKQVMKYLLKLQVVKKHAEFLGLASKQAGVDS